MTMPTRPSGKGQDVVPVPADLDASATGHVACRDGRARDVRQAVRQEAALQEHGVVALALVQPRPLESLCAQAREGNHEGALLVAERVLGHEANAPAA
jgi:hypothetical protein